MLQVKRSTITGNLTNASSLDNIVIGDANNCSGYNTLYGTVTGGTLTDSLAYDSGWFINYAGGDYRIDETNTSAMTALTGTGWNSSNIVEWAWATPEGEPPPPAYISPAIFYNMNQFGV